MINPGNNIPDPGGIPMHPELGVPGEVEKTPLKFFERKEGELFPEFKFEKIFKDFKEKLGDKIPLDALDGFKEGVGSGNFDLSWTVEFDWYNHHYGPLKVDIGKVLKEYSTTDICNNLRNLILFYICIVCLLAVIGIIFDSP